MREYSLANCEIYLALFAVFGRESYKLKLFETNWSDIEPAHDFFNPSARLGSKGVRIVVE